VSLRLLYLILVRQRAAKGCGCWLPRGTYFPGHDQRAIHERVARVGGIREFLDWFDRTWTG
jgi:hypothetical protein